MTSHNDVGADLDVTRLCALPHRGPLPAAEPAGRICVGHRHRLADLLAGITRRWADLPTLTTPGTTAGHRTGPTSAAPVRLDVLALTDPHTRPTDDLPPAAAWLLDWARLVADQRHHGRTPRTPGDALTVLHRNLDWLCDHPAVTDLHHELTAIDTALRRVTGDVRHPIAACQTPTGDGGECGGPLYYQPDGPVAVRCSHCGDTWSRTAVQLVIEQVELQQWLDNA